jgi:Na+/H+ antiporter NhaC
MNSKSNPQSSLKNRLVDESKQFLMIFLYLSLCLGFMVNFKRAILADYGINYREYGYVIIEALILSKIILIGHLWRLDKRRFMDKPLIYTTVYAALIFSLLVICFNVIEQVIEGWLHHKAVAETFHEMLEKGWHQMLARCLLIFVIFIPYFAFREVGELVGQGKLLELFFHRRSALTVQSSDSSAPGKST